MYIVYVCICIYIMCCKHNAQKATSGYEEILIWVESKSVYSVGATVLDALSWCTYMNGIIYYYRYYYIHSMHV